MNSDLPWTAVRLEDVAQEVTVGYVGPMVDEYRPTGIPFLRSKNIKPFAIDKDDIRYIDTVFHHKIRKSRLQPGDVVIVRTGAPGTTAVIPSWLDEANCSDLVVVRPSDRLNPRFFSYFMNAAANHQVDEQTVGAVQQHFNVGSAKQLLVPLPPRKEQDEIVEVLGSLDDRIELNLQMNHTLEAMAQGIFKSWFVDFDPVTAKVDGREPYGMNNEAAALFPAHYEESAFGPIPKGWQLSTVGKEYNITMGQSPPGETYNETGTGRPFYQGRTDFGFRYPKRRIYCSAPTRIAEPGDTLVSVRAPVGDINMAIEQCAIGRGVGAIKHKSKARSYTYYQMHGLRESFDVFEGDGTLFGSINKDGFEGIRIVVPPLNILMKYEELAGPMDEHIENNEREIATLNDLRNKLLPKLLSGEIRVKQAEKIVEEVA